jgi:hypothetical protein
MHVRSRASGDGGTPLRQTACWALQIDAELSDSAVLLGAAGLLEQWRPELLVESVSPEASEQLASLGYVEWKHTPSIGSEHYVHSSSPAWTQRS